MRTIVRLYLSPRRPGWRLESAHEPKAAHGDGGVTPLPITPERARAFLLARQGLSAPLPSPAEVVRRLVAVQVQYAGSLQTAVAARAKVVPGWAERAVAQERSVLKCWTIRHTLHAFDPADHGLLVAAVGPRLYARYRHWMTRKRGMTDAEADRLLEAVREVLRDGPQSRRTIHDRVPTFRTMAMTGWGVDVMGLAYLGELLMVDPDGTSPRFALRADWTATSAHDGSETEAAADLLLRYLDAYGPATKRDFAYWTGMPKVAVDRAFLAKRDDIVPLAMKGRREPVFLTHAGFETIQRDLPEPATVNLLAKFDPMVLAHRDKSLYLAESERAFVFRIAGQVEAAVLVRGRVAATYRVERKAKRCEFRVERHTPIRLPMRALEQAAARMAARCGWGEATVDCV
ncbi:MAG: AlkZ family DNA glycosylase [Fimbriimonadaceae bacterium]|nr:AlkZ family DNA glycosylase [Fimbriimonadaceae bacterium]